MSLSCRRAHAARAEEVPLPGALSNPGTSSSLRGLLEIVKTAASRPEPTADPKALRGRRPGWVAPLVLQTLEAATEPMTTAALTEEIASRFDQQVPYESVRYVLRYGKAAQRGLIERVGDGRYALRRAA